MLGLILNSPKTPTTQGEDVLVIRDFDPREDALVLPIDVSKSLYTSVGFYSNSAVTANDTLYPNLDLTPTNGLALSFGYVNAQGDNVTVAQVFLSQDYIDAMGFGGSGDQEAADALTNILDTAVVIGPNGLANKDGTSTGDAAYAFSGIDTSDQPDWQPAPGTQTMIFGAFGPMTIIASHTDGLGANGVIKLSGTNFGDIITANEMILPADQVLHQFGIADTDSELFGFGGDDFLYGGNAKDNLFGGDGNDHLYGFDVTASTKGGSNYWNALHGEAGDDVLVAGTGYSAMDGGTGSDTVSYELSPAGVTIDLSTPPDFSGSHEFAGVEYDFPGVTFTGHATTPDGSDFSPYDIFANIENVIGSPADDIITGTTGKNIIDPGLGDDTITGNGGADTISYRSAPAGVAIDLSTQTTTKSDGQGTNYTDHYAGFVNAYGSDFDDDIIGTSGNNVIDPGLGNDAVHGNGGVDTISYHNEPAGVLVDLHTASATKTNAPSGAGLVVYTDSLAGISNIRGSNYDDQLLRGNEGDNVFFYSAGNDKIDGIGGTDTLNYKDAPGAVTVNVNTGKTQKTVDNGSDPSTSAGTDSFRNIEHFVGSAYDDTIIGGSFSNQKTSTVALSGITALAFDGGKGHDTLVFKGSIGDVDIAHDFSEVDGDTLTAAIKHIEFLKFDEFTVELKQFDAALTNRAGNSHVNGSGLSELIVGHKSQADHLSGGKGDDALLGLGGDDLLRGGKGQDLLLGNDGADRLKGGDGADRLKGGAGKDALFGGAGKDDVQGGAGADSLHGGNGGDTLGGGKGDDALFGGDGGDILNGGLGDDRLAGGKGPDTFVFSTALGPHNVDTIADFGAGDVIALDASIFEGIGPKGELADALFATSLFDTGVHPIHPDARIIYNPLSGNVFYDENGNQPGGLTLFARVVPNTVLDHTDFFVV